MAIYDEPVVGFVSRDHSGYLIRVDGKLLPPSSVLYVELVAAWFGLETAMAKFQEQKFGWRVTL